MNTFAPLTTSCALMHTYASPATGMKIEMKRDKTVPAVSEMGQLIWRKTEHQSLLHNGARNQCLYWFYHLQHSVSGFARKRTCSPSGLWTQRKLVEAVKTSSRAGAWTDGPRLSKGVQSCRVRSCKRKRRKSAAWVYTRGELSIALVKEGKTPSEMKEYLETLDF